MRLWQELEKLKSDGPYPFHMPGHKRNFAGAFEDENPGKTDMTVTASEIDITEIDGFDNLHNPEGVLLEESRRAAKLFGSRDTFLLVNGSTCGNLAAIAAAVPIGGRVLMQKDSHKSVYNGVRLRAADIVYITSDISNKNISNKDISEEIEAALESAAESASEPAVQKSPSPKSAGGFDLVILTSPDYIGETLDIAGICRICHKHGVPVLVDAAHGAHFRFSDNFPRDAVSAGADLVVNSLHKTLPSLTSTALLHVNGDLVDINQVKYYTQVFQTSSPSYVLMSSISRCLQFLEEESGEFESYVNRLEDFYKATKDLKNLKVRQFANAKDSETPAVQWDASNGGAGGEDEKKLCDRRKTDMGKIVIYPPEGLTGLDLARILRRDYKIEPEMAVPEYMLCMTSVCDSSKAFLMLSDVLHDIDRRLDGDGESQESGDNKDAVSLLAGLAGTTAKVDLVPYPPGIPLVLRGELITEEKAKAMEKILLAGGRIEGIG